MILIDKMKNMKIYKTQMFLPTLANDKKKQSAIFLLTPNYTSSKSIMNSPLFVNKLRYSSYYLERNLSYYIDSKYIEDTDEDQNEIEENFNYQSLIIIIVNVSPISPSLKPFPRNVSERLRPDSSPSFPPNPHFLHRSPGKRRDPGNLMLPGFLFLSKWRDSNPRPFGPEPINTPHIKYTGGIIIFTVRSVRMQNTGFFFYNMHRLTDKDIFLL